MKINGYKLDPLLVQKRIGNTSIGVSTLRNQGAKGIIKGARNFLCELDLSYFKNDVTEREYRNWLDQETEELTKIFAQNYSIKSWGAARKSVNIFMENIFYDRYMTQEYNLLQLEYYLEVPVDKSVREGIVIDLIKKLEFKPENIANIFPKWQGIKNLMPEDNNTLQEYANKLAKYFGMPRIFLDLRYWRSEITA